MCRSLADISTYLSVKWLFVSRCRAGYLQRACLVWRTATANSPSIRFLSNHDSPAVRTAIFDRVAVASDLVGERYDHHALSSSGPIVRASYHNTRELAMFPPTTVIRKSTRWARLNGKYKPVQSMYFR